MTTRVTKVWWDGEKLREEQIAESEIYKPEQEPFGHWHWEQPMLKPLQGWFVKGPSNGTLNGVLGIPLYTTPPKEQQSCDKRQPLTDEETYEVTGAASVELFKLAKQWSANEIHSYQFDNEARKIIKAVLSRAFEAAHGIKETT